MSKFKVTITESHERVLIVDAPDAWTAKRKVVDDYYTEKIILGRNDFQDVEIYVEKETDY